MFTTGSNEEINVWDLAQPQRIKVLSGHQGSVHSLCVYADILYSGDAERFVHVWSATTFQLMHSFVACDDIVSALACSERHLFAGSFATIKIWTRGDAYKCVRTISGLQHWVRSLMVDHTQSLLFGASHKTVNIWHAAAFTLVRAVKTEHGSVHSIAITPKYLIVGTYNRVRHHCNEMSLM